VGFDLADDAGVVRLPDGSLLIQTVDFFTPIVDDPYTFGRIAAANSLSDVYAMGGTPLSAMNILCWPQGSLPVSALGEMMRGAADTVVEAGAILVGGHSVKDGELKFGLSVSGLVSAEGLWTNAGARAGDVLVLTKPLGTGILTTALKRRACPEDAERAAVDAMATLNKAAFEAAAEGTVHACTDITGNGLIGHAWEMAHASGVCLRIESDRLPLLPHVCDLAEAGHITGANGNNRTYVGDLRWDGVGETMRRVLADPQTSGGLLLSVPPADAARLEAAGIGSVVGAVEEGSAALHIV